MVRIHPVSIERSFPGQDQASLQFPLPSTPHAITNETAFVLGDGAANLQQQLIVRILAHRAIQELHAAAVFFDLLQQQTLVDEMTRQPIGSGDED